MYMQLSQSVCGWREIYKSYEIMLMLCDCGQWTVSCGAAVAGEQVRDNRTTREASPETEFATVSAAAAAATAG